MESPTAWTRLLGGCVALAASMGCFYDFSEAVPCDSTDDCPVSLACDLDFRRCVPSASVADDVVEERDTRPLPDLGLEDADADLPDAATDPLPDEDVDSGPVEDVADGTSDADGQDAEDVEVVDPPDGEECVPAPEVCDGVDNDCDGAVDEDGVCDGPCPAGMTRVTDGGIDVCIDTWEASRADATADNPGTDNSRAESRPGVLPWALATFDQAQSACTAAGKRLCTAPEWTMACASSAGNVYPYDLRLYNGLTCNGLNVDPRTGPAATGAFEGCVSVAGVFDLSGNLAEWSDDRRALGGAYNSVQGNLTCQRANADVNPTVADPTIGFRCCATPRDGT